ncbi:metal-dependent phosphohydrolase [Saprospira sp. CCB-QB6]|uniref:HD domain-containing protein n=1 Tax=Saprospira sp. CCB-QB6 TaxID=3023936 RepID=UPI002349B709|nr:metal-dependent phosphohydrolase [Saprospira sp. CCB-QB6]WCL80390.1 metal-dependent phosphohydrolase [Saprospira sp. CCB-QB6]
MQLNALITACHQTLRKQRATLCYHNLDHTQGVVAAVSILPFGQDILIPAAYLHDLGYAESAEGHEAIAIDWAKEKLPKWNFKEKQIDEICQAIAATQVGQCPSTKLGAYLKDADISYSLSSHFWRRGSLLRQEWALEMGQIYSDMEWLQLQSKFLKQLQFFSPWGQHYLEPLRRYYLQQVAERLQKMNI